MNRSLKALILVSVSALVLAGCGSSSEVDTYQTSLRGQVESENNFVTIVREDGGYEATSVERSYLLEVGYKVCEALVRTGKSPADIYFELTDGKDVFVASVIAGAAAFLCPDYKSSEHIGR